MWAIYENFQKTHFKKTITHWVSFLPAESVPEFDTVVTAQVGFALDVGVG
jgi:hypothetical protein